MEDVLSVLKTRRSIRSYRPDMITEQELDAILEAGTFAPSGKGMQSSQIVVVQNKDVIQQLVRMNQEVLGGSNDPYYGAPMIVLVFAQKDNPNHIQDASLVLGNMMNAAHALGVGTCWINRERQMFESEEGKQLMASWGVEEGSEGVGALSMGYPNQSVEAKPRKSNYIIKVK